MTTKTNKYMRINQKREVQDLKEGRYPKARKRKLKWNECSQKGSHFMTAFCKLFY